MGWGSKLIDLVFCGTLVAIGHDTFNQLEGSGKRPLELLRMSVFLYRSIYAGRLPLPCLGGQKI